MANEFQLRRPLPKRRWLLDLILIAAGLVLPLGVASLWIPVRDTLPDTDLALILVLAVLAFGLTGHRPAVALSGVSAALWFEFLDTKPFEDFAIQRTPDLETTLTLALVAMVGGQVAVSVIRARSSVKTGTEKLASISRAASQLASGDELVLVIQAVAEDLKRLFALIDCVFEVAPPDPSRARIERDGELWLPDQERLSGHRSPHSWESSELPVWGHRQIFGHFVLDFHPGARQPKREDCLAAIALSDQVGAAFMAQAPFPPDPRGASAPHLRVVPGA